MAREIVRSETTSPMPSTSAESCDGPRCEMIRIGLELKSCGNDSGGREIGGAASRTIMLREFNPKAQLGGDPLIPVALIKQRPDGGPTLM